MWTCCSWLETCQDSQVWFVISEVPLLYRSALRDNIHLHLIFQCISWIWHLSYKRYLTGAELANVVNEGALECGRRGGSLITSLDIYNGMDRILQVRDAWPPGNKHEFSLGEAYFSLSLLWDSSLVYWCMGVQGIKRPGLPKRMKMLRRLTAYEVGKGLTATILRKQRLDAGQVPHLEGVERVTIVPRGR